MTYDDKPLFVVTDLGFYWDVDPLEWAGLRLSDVQRNTLYNECKLLTLMEGCSAADVDVEALDTGRPGGDDLRYSVRTDRPTELKAQFRAAVRKKLAALRAQVQARKKAVKDHLLVAARVGEGWEWFEPFAPWLARRQTAIATARTLGIEPDWRTIHTYLDEDVGAMRSLGVKTDCPGDFLVRLPCKKLSRPAKHVEGASEVYAVLPAKVLDLQRDLTEREAELTDWLKRARAKKRRKAAN